MNAVFLQLVAFAGALAFILPPGWCAGVAQLVQSDSPPAKTTCCHTPAPAKAAPCGEAPPSARCCCLKDATVPERLVGADDEESPRALPALFAELPPVAAWGRGGERVDFTSPFLSGPRLHVLQCVWRN